MQAARENVRVGAAADRLPGEIKSSTIMAGRNRLLQQQVVEQIAMGISTMTGMPMSGIDIMSLIGHIKRLDGNKFATMSEAEAVEAVVNSYVTYSAARNDVIYDMHEIIKQYIGGGVKVSPSRFLLPKNGGTFNGMPPDPASVRQTAHFNAYAMDPRLDGFASGSGPEQTATGQTVLRPRTQTEEDYLLTRSGKADDLSGVPVQGAYVRRGDVIRPREKSTYFLLDSRYRNRSIGPNVFSWMITPMPNDARGVACAQAGMGNIVYMEFDQFYIPYVPGADTPSNQVSLLVEELGMAAIIAHENRQYHVLFSTTIDGNRILLTPIARRFSFNEPITRVDRMSITFGNPLVQINFLPDDYAVTITYNAPNSTYINFTSPHFMADGEVVLLTGFTTANPARDFAVIGQINSTLGNAVAVVDDVTLEITLDLTGVTLATPTPSVDCFITARRVQIPVRFGTII